MVYSCSCHNRRHSALYAVVSTVHHPWVSCMQCQKSTYLFMFMMVALEQIVTHYSNTTLGTSRSLSINGTIASYPSSRKELDIDFQDLMRHLETLQFKHEAYRNQCKEQQETNNDIIWCATLKQSTISPRLFTASIQRCNSTGKVRGNSVYSSKYYQHIYCI